MSNAISIFQPLSARKVALQVPPLSIGSRPSHHFCPGLTGPKFASDDEDNNGNADAGHAQRAVAAVKASIPKLENATQFWKRACGGYRINNSGSCTQTIINKPRLGDEAVAIFKNKGVAGHGAHSDCCGTACETVNDRLNQPDFMPFFLVISEGAGCIKPGLPGAASPFGSFLQGERAEMFGASNHQELRIIHDRIIGDAAEQGLSFNQTTTLITARKQMAGRVIARTRPLEASMGRSLHSIGAPTYFKGAHRVKARAIDANLTAVRAAGLQAQRVDAQATVLSGKAMARPPRWTSAGPSATRAFLRCMGQTAKAAPRIFTEQHYRFF